MAAARLLPVLLLAACSGAGPRAAASERVRVSPDGKGFQLAESGRPFTPWGFNYDHDVTGLGCYRRSDTPAWYEGAQEKDRWPIQARFWEAIAATCAMSPAVLCYNLMNEPVSPGGPGQVWHGGTPLGGYFYVENLTLDPGTRSRLQVTREWIATLTPGIRRWDPKRLVTCGMFFLFEVPGGLTLGPA